jgi:hypothetical protein
MIVSLKHGFVFLCMPKCASTSTEDILRPYGQLVTDGTPSFKHINFRQYERLVKPLVLHCSRSGQAPRRRFPALEVVCLFREPTDWLFSWYRYRSRESLLRNKRRASRQVGGISFEEFAREYVSESPRPFARVGRQINFIKNAKGEIKGIKVFRYEDYAAFIAYMSSRLGAELVAPRLNESPQAADQQKYRFDFLESHLAEDYEFYRSIPVLA